MKKISTPEPFVTFFDPDRRHPSPYNEANPYVARSRTRIDATCELLREVIPGCSVLDIGASPFYFLWRCEQLGAKKVAGAFYSNDSHPLADAAHLYTQHGSIDLAHCNVITERLPWPDASFDLVTAFEVFEHFAEYPALQISEITRVLKPGGTFAITVPNACSIHKLIKILLNQNPFMKYRPDSFGRHAHEYTNYQLAALMRVANCDSPKVRYLSSSTNNRRSALSNLAVRCVLALPGMKRFRPVVAATGKCRGYVPLDQIEFAPELFESRHSIEI